MLHFYTDNEAPFVEYIKKMVYKNIFLNIKRYYGLYTNIWKYKRVSNDNRR